MAKESTASNPVQGYADVAANKDALNLDNYVEGISRFIKECATPMTISIQGDWGTGKTSLFNLIESNLRAEKPDASKGKYGKDIIDVVTVNTWQYAIAGYRNDLIRVIVSEVISKLSQSGPDIKKKVFEKGHLLLRFFYAWAANGAELESGPVKESDIEALLKNCQEISKLKDELATVVDEYAKSINKPNNARLVIFVDDLDRLEPEIAVNLMEGIKNFMDCARCVFVLAIDEKVVFDGIRKKYGNELGEERKKMFFDKLIQVPFRVPTSAYNIEGYVKDLLQVEEEQAVEFARVITAILNEPNPRSIKRYVNTMSLYQNILDEPETKGDSSLAMLFAAIIMKVESRQGFNALASCIDDDAALKHVLGSLNLEDGINWTNVPALWEDDGNAGSDIEKKEDFRSWIQLLEKTERPTLAGFFAQLCGMARNKDLTESDHNGGALFRRNEDDSQSDGEKVLLVKLGQGEQKLTVTAYKEALTGKDADWTTRVHGKLKELWGGKLKGKASESHITLIAELQDGDKLKDSISVIDDYLDMCCNE